MKLTFVVSLFSVLIVTACVGENNTQSTSTGGVAGSGGGDQRLVVVFPTGGAGHECPDSLVHPGSAPGIRCDEPGTTCADDDHFCECGSESIEGAPWRCVPTTAACPASIPEDGADCTGSDSCHYVHEAQRIICDCTEDSWACLDEQTFCPVLGVDAGDDCAGHEGRTCDRFLPAYSGSDMPAMNIPCSCIDETWECAEL